MKVKIAFFKGDKKKLLHRFIRWYTKSKYSHAELILPDGEQWVGISPFLTSRVGIREKKIPIEEQNDAQKKSARLKELNESIEKMQEELQQSTFDGWLKDTAKRHNYIIEKVIDKKSLKQKRGEK